MVTDHKDSNDKPEVMGDIDREEEEEGVLHAALHLLYKCFCALKAHTLEPLHAKCEMVSLRINNYVLLPISDGIVDPGCIIWFRYVNESGRSSST